MNKIKLIIVIMFLINIYCNKKNKKVEYPIGGPYYYKHANLYKIPNRYYGLISIEEAKDGDVYYEVYFNNERQVFKSIRHLNNKVDFTQLYYYRENGLLKKRYLINEKGDTVVQKYDKNGNILKGKHSVNHLLH